LTPRLARRFAFWALAAWVASIVVVLLFGGVVGDPGFATIAGAVLLAAATALVISWVTSMVAGPFALVKMRNRPDTLDVWKSIVLPLSLATGLILAIALPVRWSDGCEKHEAVVPMITAPIYVFGSPGDASLAYFQSTDSTACSGA
jgi:hypothetical protein